MEVNAELTALIKSVASGIIVVVGAIVVVGTIVVTGAIVVVSIFVLFACRRSSLSNSISQIDGTTLDK